VIVIGVMTMLVLAAVAVAVIEIRDPKADTSSTVESVEGTVGVLVGLVAGYVTGRAGLGNRDTGATGPVEPRSAPETGTDSLAPPGPTQGPP
jgi:hypothetical protein